MIIIFHELKIKKMVGVKRIFDVVLVMIL